MRAFPHLTLASLLAVAGLVTACADRQPSPTSSDTPEAPPEDPPADPEVTELASDPDEPRRGTIYVPAYSHIRSSARRNTLLVITLSLRNVDSERAVTLRYVDYYDTPGHRVRRYLDAPRRLRPLETAEYYVETIDDVGGSGANFLVGWTAVEGTHALLAEAVMVGHVGDGYVSFTSRGVELDVPIVVPPPLGESPASGAEAPSPTDAPMDPAAADDPPAAE